LLMKEKSVEIFSSFSWSASNPVNAFSPYVSNSCPESPYS
jgi:hypothetical protein